MSRGYAVSDSDAKKYREGWDQIFGKKDPEDVSEGEMVYACPECGCEDIEGTAWIHLNSGEDSGSEPPGDEYFCPACDLRTGDGHVGIAMFFRNDPTRKNQLRSHPEFVPVFKSVEGE